MTSGPDLLDLLAAEEKSTDPRSETVHICLPSMGYVCGGDILGLPDGGPGGHMVLGGASEEHWAQASCPECKAPGRREVGRIAHRQQKPVGHVCDDSCFWTLIPEEVAS